MSTILTDVRDGIGFITINRPTALNALNYDVVLEIRSCLKKWEVQDSVHMVVVQGQGDKAFCAGGDIKSIYQAHQENNTKLINAFYRDEYGLNKYIAHYKKPYMALCDGICMGGGMGISVLGKYRVATDRSVWAMPETAIGLFPDVGAGYFLNQCPGFIGLFLGLTGYRMRAADLMYTGLATHYIPSDRLDLLQETLVHANTAVDPQGVLEEALSIYAIEPPEPAPLALYREGIDVCFAHGTVEDIIDALERHAGEWAENALVALDKMSPTSLKVTQVHLKQAKGKSINQVIDLDYKLSQKFMAKKDFFEGVRALLVDKDKYPQWHPKKLQDVTDEMVEVYFN